jgi:hypothetical protein
VAAAVFAAAVLARHVAGSGSECRLRGFLRALFGLFLALCGSTSAGSSATFVAKELFDTSDVAAAQLAVAVAGPVDFVQEVKLVFVTTIALTFTLILATAGTSVSVEGLLLGLEGVGLL